jgi:hypothetical protein
MLTVDDDAFWEGVEPVVFGSLPQLQVSSSSGSSSSKGATAREQQLQCLW